MIKKIFLVSFIISFEICSQPIPTEYYTILQEDSLYYLLTDKALFKFYSPGSDGDFYLTRYVKGNFNSSMTLAINDDYLFLKRNDSVDVYLSSTAWDLNYKSTFVPDYSLYQWGAIFGFGPYVFIRTGNYYNLLKVQNGEVVTVEDSLFTHPSQMFVFFCYPYVIRANTVYKYIENFDFYAVGNISYGNAKAGIYENKLIWHHYNYYPVETYLRIITIEEPDFPYIDYLNWGINIPQIHYFDGQLIPKKNLYFFSWSDKIILTTQAQIAYIPSSDENAMITDNYIFLLGDSVSFSKWYAGSTFYPFTWTDITNVKNQRVQPSDFTLSQNYPNPFNPTTKIKYQLHELSKVKLTIYDVLGRGIRTLVNEEKPAGSYEVEFDGSGFPSGVYFYRIEARSEGSNSFSATKKFILLK